MRPTRSQALFLYDMNTLKSQQTWNASSSCAFILPLKRPVLVYAHADMEFVKKFTQAWFLKTKFYPKERKSQWTQDTDKTT